MSALRQTERVSELLAAVNIEKLIDDEIYEINQFMGGVSKSEVPVGMIKSCIGLQNQRTGEEFQLDIEVSLKFKVKRRKV